MKPVAIAVLLVALTLLQGCGVQTAYNNADRLLKWQIDEAVELTSEQEDWLVTWLDEQHGWHRASQLPRYALGLRQLESRLGQDFQRSDAVWFERELEAWWDTILLQAMPGVVELLQQLSDEQVAKLVTNLRDEAMEYQKEYGELSEAKWRDKWFERAREGVERLSGRLDDPQLAVLRDFQQRVEQDDGPWVTYRLRWIDGLEEVLQTRKTKPEEFAARFLAMSRDREAWYTESYRLVEAANDEHYRNLAVALTRALNEKQLGRVRKRLADLVADFEELSTG